MHCLYRARTCSSSGNGHWLNCYELVELNEESVTLYCLPCQTERPGRFCFECGTPLGGNPNAGYRVFSIPKRKGGVRIIEAPSDSLKRRQRRLLRRIHGLTISPFSYGVRRGTLQAAKAHFAAIAVMRIDIREFFPSVSERLIIETGTAERLVSWCDSSQERILNTILYVTADRRRLPQGSPTPAPQSLARAAGAPQGTATVFVPKDTVVVAAAAEAINSHTLPILVSQ
jgi:hypothetical protein